jgi:hypothetical protein
MIKLYRRWAVLLSISSLPYAPAFGASPSGAPPRDAADAFASADLVFLGKVDSVTLDRYGYPSTAIVSVVRRWKGPARVGATVTVDGTGGPTYPARLFDKGRSYLFYLPPAQAGQPLRADSYLQRVLPEADAGADLQYLAGLPARAP